jgi:hypothetical protein
MNRDDVRAFVNRGWAAVAASKRAYWAERYRAEGSLPARQASAALYDHAQRLHSAIFGETYRADDLAHHQRLRDQLDRASRAIAGR